MKKVSTIYKLIVLSEKVHIFSTYMEIPGTISTIVPLNSALFILAVQFQRYQRSAFQYSPCMIQQLTAFSFFLMSPILRRHCSTVSPEKLLPALLTNAILGKF